MDVFEKVANVLKELSGVEKITIESSIDNDLGLDSLGMVTLMLELEDAFAITFDESDLNPFELKDVNDIMELINKYIGNENEEEKG